MTQINNGGPAFPSTKLDIGVNYANANLVEGMTLRDWFAGMALQYASEFNFGSGCKPDGPTHAEGTARMAYEIADAMLKARK